MFLKKRKRKVIHLNKGILTTFVATCSELGVLTNPFYLLKLKNDTSKKDYFCILNDVSIHDRYNQFNFTEGVDDALNGKLILTNSGYYDYFIYEQLSATNLDPSLASLVEQGKMRLFDANDNLSVSQHTISGTNIIYNQ